MSIDNVDTLTDKPYSLLLAQIHNQGQYVQMTMKHSRPHG